jgi:acetyltransferase-like isoleucine patch superfamily enzyme
MPLDKIHRFLSLPFYDKCNVLEHVFYRLKGALFYRRIFKSFGKQSVIYPSMMICNPRFIRIGNGVSIRKGVRLEAVLIDENHPPEIHIGDNVNIEEGVSISTTGKIHIRANVGIGARSAIIGSAHPFFDIHDPVKISARIGGMDSVTEIGEGSFLGAGSVIQMNVTLGKYVIVGANSVVKRNVPDYSVVEGHPAVVVLSYDAQEDRWKRPSKQG